MWEESRGFLQLTGNDARFIKPGKNKLEVVNLGALSPCSSVREIHVEPCVVGQIWCSCINDKGGDVAGEISIDERVIWSCRL